MCAAERPALGLRSPSTPIARDAGPDLVELGIRECARFE
jgi:hypothetical protein